MNHRTAIPTAEKPKPESPLTNPANANITKTEKNFGNPTTTFAQENINPYF
jgi:hypothetical protein